MLKKSLFKLVSGAVCCALLLGGFPAYAAGETDDAAAYLAELGIYQGDENGNLNLGAPLTRAELAAILTRLDYIANSASPEEGLAEWRDWGEAHFADPANRCNKFTDVPDWALPYVEYCYERGLVKGVTETSFGPRTAVSPRMVCTVMLRFLGIAETDWDYGTSIDKAQTLGLLPGADIDGETITRGTMAVVIRRGLEYEAGNAAPEVVPVVVPAPQQNEPETAAENTAPAMTIDEMKAEIVRLTNEERAKAGLPALEVLPELMDCAQAKAQDMIDNHYYGHKSPRYGSAGNMIKAFVPGARTGAENLAPWTKTPAEAFQGWLDSKEHFDHITSHKYTHIGVGIVEGTNGGYWWVQHFVKP
jgi:uncharacterized protein YkwD